MKVCCKLAGTALNDPSPAFYKSRVLRKAGSGVADPSRALEEEFNQLPSGRRYRLPKVRTNRFRDSFVDAAVDVLNE